MSSSTDTITKLGRLPVDGSNLLAPGTVAYFSMATAPAGWLACDGGMYSRASYPALFAAIGTTYGIGDGSTTFNVPDLRGEFIRGLDAGRGVDAGRGIGTAQAAAVASHTHGYVGYTEGFFPTGGNNSLGAGTSADGDSGLTTAATGGDETRPRNVAMLACIKA